MHSLANQYGRAAIEEDGGGEHHYTTGAELQGSIADNQLDHDHEREAALLVPLAS
jgi:hypothetical protein